MGCNGVDPGNQCLNRKEEVEQMRDEEVACLHMLSSTILTTHSRAGCDMTCQPKPQPYQTGPPCSVSLVIVKHATEEARRSDFVDGTLDENDCEETEDGM